MRKPGLIDKVQISISERNAMPDTKAKILVVDDEPHIGELLSRWLIAEGYWCRTATNGDEAVKILEAEKFHLVVTDIIMPGLSGIDLLMIVRSSFPDVAVILVTAVEDRKTAIYALELGAYGYVIKPFDRNEILINVASALERRRITQLSEQYERSLEASVEERTREVRNREEEIIFRLISATGYRDDETGAHVKRIGRYSAVMAKALGWKASDVERIGLAAPMHDLGKIGIPDSILQKPGGLTIEEFEIMKKHPAIGAQILDGSSVPLIQMAREIAYAHHERCDGSGYPRGLAGAQIPESASIVAVVDVYDALVHPRVYRPAFTEEKALSIMIAGDGEYFGNNIFDCFLSVLPVLRSIREKVQEGA
ncbi:MAG TPA: HD domain-containing phosphohydrolase [Desulfomonilaceae bacterium]|nr:HD domain-containing phosphohydrolase [Desulfomonilaceae bacterium]